MFKITVALAIAVAVTLSSLAITVTVVVGAVVRMAAPVISVTAASAITTTPRAVARLAVTNAVCALWTFVGKVPTT